MSSFYITEMGLLADGPFDTYEDAWMRMHSIQPQSVHWAFKWGGWNIEEVGGEGDAPGIPSRQRPEGEAMGVDEFQVIPRVTSIKAKTTGYGETMKTVGILVSGDYTVEYDAGDGIKENQSVSVELTLPLEYRRRFAIGDELVVSLTMRNK